MLYRLLAICAVLPVFSYKIRSAIVVSEYTPRDMISEFSSLLSSSLSILLLDLSNSNLASLESYRPNLIFDFSRSLVYRQKIKEFASLHNILFFSPYDSSRFYEKGVFSLHPPPLIEANAIQSLLKFLNWSDFHILSSQTERSRAMFSLLSSVPLDALSNEVDQEIFDRHTAKVIKSSGNWKTLVLNEEPGAPKAFNSLENNRIYKERCGLVVSSQGSRGNFKLGTLAVVEKGLAEAQTETEYEFKAILRAISISEDIVSNFTTIFSNDLLLKGLEDRTSKGIVSSRYSILNLKDKWRAIGDIEEDKIRQGEEIVFPGNVTKMNNSPPKISLSINTGPFNPDGSLNPVTVAFNIPLQPMVGLINADPNILPNFELEFQETDCAYDFFEPECTEKNLDRIGLAQLVGINSTAVEMNLRLFKENNINIPHISLVYYNETILDKAVYPELIMISPSILYLYSIYPYILKSFGWDQAIALFNHHIDPYFRSIFLHNSESISLNVLNSQEYNYVPYLKTENYYEEVEPVLEFIRNPSARYLS